MAATILEGDPIGQCEFSRFGPGRPGGEQRQCVRGSVFVLQVKGRSLIYEVCSDRSHQRRIVEQVAESRSFIGLGNEDIQCFVWSEGQGVFMLKNESIPVEDILLGTGHL